ncbi:ferredoxin [Patescibacteria group bacterium]|nr:ferredoxin [Patescibacteria group bacterium]
MAKIKVEIDKEKCIGCGSCVALCPDYFAMEGDKAKVIKNDTADTSCVQEAESSCPVAAIETKAA